MAKLVKMGKINRNNNALVAVVAIEDAMPVELLGEDKAADVMDSVSYWRRENFDNRVMDLLWEAQRCWDNMEEFRKNREAAKRFVYSNQYEEEVVVDGKRMTEEQYIRSQGREPLTNNLERRLINNVVGTYINQDKEPTCMTRDKKEQVYGQTMSTLLQYCRGLNKMDTKMGKAIEEWLWSGMVIGKVTFGWKRKKLDCWVDMVDANAFFCDSNAKDVDDFRMMGEIHELTLQEVCSVFASGMSDEEIRRKVEWIKDEYAHCSNRSYLNDHWNRFGNHTLKEYDFFTPSETNMCRVIEIWNKESRKVLRCWDKAQGKVFTCSAQDRAWLVDNVNARRIAAALEAGMRLDAQPRTAENRGRIVPAAKQQGTEAGEAQPMAAEVLAENLARAEEWGRKIGLVEVIEGGIEEYWYVRFLTPTGRILMEMETPYVHGETPYVVCAGAFIDGEIHSFESTFHDQQKYVNRLITLQDWIMKSSAKGVLLAPEGAFDGQDIDEIADAWSSFDGVIVYKPKAGVPIPQQVSANSTNIGIHELLATQLKLFEDISGVNGALQGKQGYSATSGVLYAQQTQNATTSLMSCMMYFSQFNKDLAYKMVKVMCQFYDAGRVEEIVGDEAGKIDPEKCLNVEYDINIVESTSTPAYRQIANQFLFQLRQLGDITGEEMLEAGDFPFSDKVIQLMQARQQKMMEQQGMAAGGSANNG